MEDESLVLAVAVGTAGLACDSLASQWDVYLMTRTPHGEWTGPFVDNAAPLGEPAVRNTYGLVGLRKLAGAVVLLDVTSDSQLRATRIPAGAAPQVALSDAACGRMGAAFVAKLAIAAEAQTVVVGGRCVSPLNGGFLLILKWTESGMEILSEVPPANAQPKMAFLSPLGGDGDTTKLLVRYEFGLHSFALFSDHVFSTEVVPFYGPSQEVPITFPLAASNSSNAHVLFGCEMDEQDIFVPRFPFAIRVEF